MNLAHWFKVSCLVISILLVFTFTHYTLMVKSEQLNTEYRIRHQEYLELREQLLSLSTEIHMLEVEIYALQNDNEESSLAARTLLGMVHAAELVYQLNHRVILAP
jgi:cell division protein FtsB